MNEFSTIINSFGAMFGLFLSTAFFFRREGGFTDRILGASIFSLSLIMSVNYLHYKGFAVPHFFIRGPVTYVYWPLFYFYISLMILKIEKLKRVQLLHFIPSVLVLIFKIVFWFLKEQLTKAEVNTVMELESVVRLFYGWIYCVLMIRGLMCYRKKIEEYFSDIEKINLRWLAVLVTVYTVIWSSGTIYITLEFFGFSMPEIFSFAILLLDTSMVLWICIVGYFAVANPDLFKEIHTMSAAIQNPEERKQNAGVLDPRTMEEHGNKLKQFMESEKPYLNRDLTLSMLADGVGIQPHILSKVINNYFNQNFFSFINSHRVDEVKVLLADPKSSDKNVLFIAYDCGFKSKSGFNASFKKITGQTPSQFRKSVVSSP